MMYPIQKFCVFANPTLYFGQILDLENTLQDPADIIYPHHSNSHSLPFQILVQKIFTVTQHSPSQMIVSIVTLYQWKLHSFVMMHCTVCTDQGRFPFNLKFRKIWLVHQMEWTISVWSDQLYARPALKVVHFDRSCYLGQSDRNVPFHLTKLLSPVPLFCILLTRTITKCTVAWVGSVQPECTVLCGISKMSNRNFG